MVCMSDNIANTSIARKIKEKMETYGFL